MKDRIGPNGKVLCLQNTKTMWTIYDEQYPNWADTCLHLLQVKSPMDQSSSPTIARNVCFGPGVLTVQMCSDFECR